MIQSAKRNFCAMMRVGTISIAATSLTFGAVSFGAPALSRTSAVGDRPDSLPFATPIAEAAVEKLSSRDILLNGQTVANVPAFVQNGTTYMPFWYVMQVLNKIGVGNTWDGYRWVIGSAVMDVNTQTNVHYADIFVQGGYHARVDRFVYENTSYIPIWYVMQSLKKLGIDNYWNGSDWTILSDDASVQQEIDVVASSYSSHYATMHTYFLEGGRKVQAFPAMPAVTGYNGIAPVGAKREGDGKTPAGTYSMGFEFGYAPTFATKMPYRQATADDFWVDDVTSPQYNEWVSGTPNAKSYERMKRSDNLYEYGAVIDYNTNRVPGMGSAVFLHEWRSSSSPTAGCVAISRDNLVKILQWLNPDQHPTIHIFKN